MLDWIKRNSQYKNKKKWYNRLYNKNLLNFKKIYNKLFFK